VIVLEGPDNAGKSTLAQFLSRELGYTIQGSEGPPKGPGEMDQRLERYAKLPTTTIFDRHPVVSQPIYCSLRGGDPQFNVKHWEQWFYKEAQPTIIYCDPLERGLDGHKRNTVDTDEHLQQIHDNYMLLTNSYRKWALRYAHHIYRIGDGMGRILRAIKPSFTDDIRDFHRKFELEYTGQPRELLEEVAKFRVKFMVEELGEYCDPSRSNWHAIAEEFFTRALPSGRLEDKFDALIDLVYVALGTAHLHGFNFDEGWRRVHAANMTKRRARKREDSKRESTYDVVKPEGWVAPNLSDLVQPLTQMSV